eukprot:2436138-Amphidinium_carterae.1
MWLRSSALEGSAICAFRRAYSATDLPCTREVLPKLPCNAFVYAWRRLSHWLMYYFMLALPGASLSSPRTDQVTSTFLVARFIV